MRTMRSEIASLKVAERSETASLPSFAIHALMKRIIPTQRRRSGSDFVI